MAITNYFLGARALCSLLNRKSWRPFLHTWQRTKFDFDFLVSYSQFGEDLALMNLFGEKIGKYLDIGAHHPSRFSNTRLLYDKGWRGVNVEANPELMPELEKKRSRDINVWACVGIQESYTFTIFKEPALSTSNLEWKVKFEKQGKAIKQEVHVRGKKLKTLIEEYFPNGDLDLLLIDAEGADYEILISAEFKTLPRFRLPKYVLVEAPYPLATAMQQDSVKYLLDEGYEILLVLFNSTILRLNPDLLDNVI